MRAAAAAGGCGGVRSQVTSARVPPLCLVSIQRPNCTLLAGWFFFSVCPALCALVICHGQAKPTNGGIQILHWTRIHHMSESESEKEKEKERRQTELIIVVLWIRIRNNKQNQRKSKS